MVLVTDLGHDPDDAIALSYLIEHGIVPEFICVSPGFPDQVKAVNGIIEAYDAKSIVMRCSDKESINYDAGKHKLLFGSNKSILIDTIVTESALVIGPPLNIGKNLISKSMVFQGGYSPNSINPIPKFDGLKEVQSFNPCGAKADFNLLLENVEEKYFVGKNVCHRFLKSNLSWCPENKLIRKFFDLLPQNKAIHDVLAAMCFIDRNIGVWEQSRPIWIGNKLSTIPTNNKSFSLIGLIDD